MGLYYYYYFLLSQNGHDRYQLDEYNNVIISFQFHLPYYISCSGWYNNINFAIYVQVGIYAIANLALRIKFSYVFIRYIPINHYYYQYLLPLLLLLLYRITSRFHLVSYLYRINLSLLLQLIIRKMRMKKKDKINKAQLPFDIVLLSHEIQFFFNVTYSNISCEINTKLIKFLPYY